jgi:hypothetical protein
MTREELRTEFDALAPESNDQPPHQGRWEGPDADVPGHATVSQEDVERPRQLAQQGKRGSRCQVESGLSPIEQLS